MFYASADNNRKQDALSFRIVRPSVVRSSIRFPFTPILRDAIFPYLVKKFQCNLSQMIIV